MLDLNNLRKEKHEDLCKIIDYVLVAFLAVFFILSLFPYFSVEKGGTVESRGFSITASEDDSWSLLGFCGFPYNHSSVSDWQEDMYKENKTDIKENEANGYKGFFKGTLGRMGVTFTNDDGEKVGYVDLAVPGITTKTISIKQVGAILFLDIFAIIGILWLLLKKGTGRAVYTVIWGIIGALAFNKNYLLNMSSNWVRPVMLAIVVIVLVVALVDSVLYIIDGRSRAAYLKSVSAAYA